MNEAHAIPAAATANDHIFGAEKQAFRIDTDGGKGKTVSPVLVPTEMPVGDARNGTMVNFADDNAASMPCKTGDRRFETTFQYLADHVLLEFSGKGT